jgi:hypothetical protein
MVGNRHALEDTRIGKTKILISVVLDDRSPKDNVRLQGNLSEFYGTAKNHPEGILRLIVENSGLKDSNE